MAATETSLAGTYLSFTLGEEDFAVEIAKVREVLDYPPITKVPRMPEYMCGVTNIRGDVVPLIDMCQKLGMPAIQRTVDTCVVIVDAEMEGETVTVGCLADSVKEVFELTDAQIGPPPQMGTRIRADFLRGMGQMDERFLMILDIDRVLSAGELAAVATAAQVDAAGVAGPALEDAEDAPSEQVA